MTDDVDRELDKTSAALMLSAGARRVHGWVLSRFIQSGSTPRRAEIEVNAREHGVDPTTVLAELTANDLVQFDATGEVRAAYPWSPSPTGIRVSWAGGPTVYAMCAVDALGVSAMIDRPVVITAAEPDAGKTVTVEVDHDHTEWTPATSVVYAGRVGDRTCADVDSSCGAINFFTSADAADEWAARHPEVSGAVLEQPHALAAGIAEFANLLHPIVSGTRDPRNQG